MLVEVAYHLVQLADDGLSAQTATVLVVPGAERPCRGFEFLDLSAPDPAAPDGWVRGWRVLEPGFQGVEEGGAEDGGAG